MLYCLEQTVENTFKYGPVFVLEFAEWTFFEGHLFECDGKG